jgi:hypothetical protein
MGVFVIALHLWVKAVPGTDIVDERLFEYVKFNLQNPYIMQTF